MPDVPDSHMFIGSDLFRLDPFTIYTGQCGCGCHRGLGMKHVVACCHPSRETAYRAVLVPPPAAECTGIAAIWCPACGDCTCIEDDDGYLLHGGCPLHDISSLHAESSWR